MNEPGFFIVGRSAVRLDARDKVRGVAPFIDDLHPAGMLYGRVLRSPHPHARIVRVDLTRARRVSGVKAVIAGDDMPYLHGESFVDEPFLARQRVRYTGEAVAAVAALDEEAAEEALDLIEVEYEPLPAVFDPVASANPGAVLLHPDLHTYARQPSIVPIPGTNVCNHLRVRKGDVDRGFLDADEIFEDTFATQRQAHACIETHGAICLVTPDGWLTLWANNDSPYRCRREIASSLKLPLHHVRVILPPYIGGNFGGKGGLKAEAIAIALAWNLRGRPIKVIYDREEEFTSSLTRHPSVTRIRTGVRRDGTIVARQVVTHWDTGAYAEKGPTVSRLGGMSAAGPYNIPNVSLDGYCVYTNKPVAGAYRGYGGPQTTWAYESQMDIIAERLGIDPVELRLKNAFDEGSQHPGGQTLSNVSLKACLREVARRLEPGHPLDRGSAPDPGSVARGDPGAPLRSLAGAPCAPRIRAMAGNSTRTLARPRTALERLQREQNPRQAPRSGPIPDRGSGALRGKGVAFGERGIKTPFASSAFVKVNEDGTVDLLASTSEVGQGSETVLSQIAAEELGVPLHHVAKAGADTALTPFDESSTSSRSTFHMGNAVRDAARDAREQVLAIAADVLKADAGDLEIRDGVVRHKTRGDVAATIAQVLKRRYGTSSTVLGRGFFYPDGLVKPDDYFALISVFWMYAAQGAEVEVDPDTGRVTVLRIVAAHDVGRAINPANCRYQIEGAIAQGIGLALYEDLVLEDGSILNPSFDSYKIPTALDMPEIDAALVEMAHERGPFGAKTVGEPALVPTAAAIGNAIADAIGVHIKDLPITPEKVLAAIRQTRQAAAVLVPR